MKTIAKRLVDGQDLLSEIDKLLYEHDVQAGIVLSAVGSLRQSNIRVPVIDGQVIDSLHGTVSKYGCHLHISVSDTEGKVWGGHVKEGCIIRTTCELVIGILDGINFVREPDQATGYNELRITRRGAKP